MKKWVSSLHPKSLNKYLYLTTALFVVMTFIVAYLGGDHKYITFQQGVLILVLSALPGLVGTLLIYMRASAEDRKGYNFRFGLVALFIIAKIWYDYM
ncbi:hypothetical protein N6H14_33650 [Paenibacillus sp. CC-CFT747]|nr:hypothetical protein N6H14_33650 [Paenibacillus sp. CC-CFT747]